MKKQSKALAMLFFQLMLLMTLIACASPGPTIYERDQVAEQLIEQAEKLQGQGDYEAAIAKYQEFIDRGHYIVKGGEPYRDSLIKGGEFYDIHDASKAIGAIYITWAEELQKQGKYDQAIEKYRAFVDVGVDISKDGQSYVSYDAMKAIGGVYITWAEELQAQGKYDQAIEEYEAFIDGGFIISRDGEHYGSFDAERALGAVYVTWAEEFQKQGKYCQAIEKYQAFIDMDVQLSKDGLYYSKYDAQKDLEGCYYGSGKELQEQGNYAAAIEKFAAVPRSSDDYERTQEAIPACYYPWAMQLKGQGQNQQAIEKYILILERHPKLASEENGDGLLRGMPATDLVQSFLPMLEEERWEGAVWLYQAISNFYPNSREADDAQQALEDAVGTYVAKVADSEHAKLPDFTITGELAEGLATIEIRNACPYILTVFLSGPNPIAISILPHPDATTYSFQPWGDPSYWKARIIQLEPSQYQLVAKVSDPAISPYYGMVELGSDQKHTCYFYIVRRL